MKTSYSFKKLCIIIAFIYAACALSFSAYAASTDPVYDSMTEPSESRSDYMISAKRDKGQLLGNPNSAEVSKVQSIGAIYKTSGKTLPSNFSIYIGKLKLFAYSKSKARWIVLTDQAAPSDFYIYTLPWTTSTSTKCKKVTYTDSYAKVDLTAKDLDNAVLHFWGARADMNKSDYLYYACAYTFWSDSSAAGKLTATNGIDAKSASNDKVIQLYSSRGLSSSTTHKIHWGHNVPKDDYSKYKTSTLNQLYESGTIQSSSSSSTSKSSQSSSSSSTSKSSQSSSSSSTSKSSQSSSNSSSTNANQQYEYRMKMWKAWFEMMKASQTKP